MAGRLELVGTLSQQFSGMSDEVIRRLVVGSDRLGRGIGGSTSSADVDGLKVFIKQIPLCADEESALTDTERRLALPFSSHYGIVSPSHGVARELAVHDLTTDWVLNAEIDCFPIMLGWRTVDEKCSVDLSEFDEASVQRRWGTYWPEVDRAVSAMRSAEKSVVIFLEWVPDTLSSWMRSQILADAAGNAFAMAVDQIIDGAGWMKSQGLVHFDLHPGNILVRNNTLLFTDFGLAVHRDFATCSDEVRQIVDHEDFDRDSGLMYLFHWMLHELGMTERSERRELLHIVASQRASSALDPLRPVLGESADIIAQYAPTVSLMTEMYDALLKDATATDYVRTKRNAPIA